jgi:hypothetical protein
VPEWLVSLLLVVAGEIVLGLLALRVLWWALRGWREALTAEPLPPEPDGPGGRPVLVLVKGDRAARRKRSPSLRAAA